MMNQRPLSSPDRRGKLVRNTVAVLLGINVSVLVFAGLVIGISRLPALPRGGGQGWNWLATLIIGGTALVAIVMGALVIRGVTFHLRSAQGRAARLERGLLPEGDPPGQRLGRSQLVPSRTRDDPPLG
jgi:hypothetical protein